MCYLYLIIPNTGHHFTKFFDNFLFKIYKLENFIYNSLQEHKCKHNVKQTILSKSFKDMESGIQTKTHSKNPFTLGL